MTTTRSSRGTRLQCPECRREILPGSADGLMTHVTCGLCGREIFLDPISFERVECQKCEDLSENELNSNRVTCCC